MPSLSPAFQLEGPTVTRSAQLPVLIRRSDVPAVFGFSERQLKRWCEQGRLSRVYPGGSSTGAVFLKTAELERLVEDCTVPAGQKAGRKPQRRKSS